MFERYVNFEFYETTMNEQRTKLEFERYVNFEFYETINRALYIKARLRDM